MTRQIRILLDDKMEKVLLDKYADYLKSKGVYVTLAQYVRMLLEQYLTGTNVQVAETQSVQAAEVQTAKKEEKTEDKKTDADKYKWVYDYIRKNGYIPLDKIKSRGLSEWISRREDIVHLTSLGCYTSDEVFRKLSWNDSEACYKCSLCEKRFAYGDLLKALEHVAREHLAEKK